MRTTVRKAASALLAGLLVLGAPACSDEDGDGAVTDEEVGDVRDRVDDARKEVDQATDEAREQVDQATDEAREQVDDVRRRAEREVDQGPDGGGGGG